MNYNQQKGKKVFLFKTPTFMYNAIRAKASFTTTVEMSDKTKLLFEYYPIYMVEKLKYLVVVFEDDVRISAFNMELVNLDWKIIKAPLVEERLLALEPYFDKRIKIFLSNDVG